MRMDNEINSKISSINDTFSATVSEPVIVEGVVLIPKESVVEGNIIKVQAAASAEKRCFGFTLRNIAFPDDNRRPISAKLADST